MSEQPKPTCENLSLSAQTVERLQTLSQEIKEHVTLQSTMFKPHLHKTRPTTAVFTGPDQQGKFAAAEALAVELSRPLLKLNVQKTIEKYIGETEKNLASIFRMAKIQEAVLLFDEADALFGKRTDVSNSHDRYANQAINYLLQHMRHYPGVMILSTQRLPQTPATQITRQQSIIIFPCTQHRDCIPQ